MPSQNTLLPTMLTDGVTDCVEIVSVFDHTDAVTTQPALEVTKHFIVCPF
jgi:hypothetical protein